MARKIKLNSVVTFTTQFASMIGAHIPLVKTIDNLEGDMTDKDLKPILSAVSSDVKRGVEFTDAIAEHPNAFDTIYVNMVGAGMASGKLDMTLKQLSTYLTKRAETANKVKSAFSYPIFMFIAMITIVTMMLIFVIPMFEKIFANSKKELPEATQIAIILSNFLQEYWMFIILTIVIIVFTIKVYITTEGGRRRVDSIKIKIPLLGVLNSKSSISKFIRTFGVLVKSDVPILKAIKLAKSSSANIIIEESIDNIVDMIERGYGVAEAFKEVELFPDIVIQMISSGEESGNLDELLISTANYYDDQVDNSIKSIVSLINPISTVIIAVFVAGLMFAVFLPIFEMGDAVG
jgi:type IV pilus assembly protein PilC